MTPKLFFIVVAVIFATGGLVFSALGIFKVLLFGTWFLGWAICMGMWGLLMVISLFLPNY